MDQMSRRSFGYALASVAVGAANLAVAQPSAKIRRIGVLEPGEPVLQNQAMQAKALQEFGWVEGKNLEVERRYARGRLKALSPLAEELVRARVEIIVTGGAQATIAAKRASGTIPIVIRVTGDAVLFGLVASLARPGGNVTGYSDSGPEVQEKILSLLKEVLPRLQRVGVLWEPVDQYARALRDQEEYVCRSLGILPIYVPIADANQINGAIEQLARDGAQALVMPSILFVNEHGPVIVEAATKAGLPTMADESQFVREAGALIAYSTTFAEQCRRRAEYIDHILRGAKPGDLPVQQPTTFELVINLKTARALGITIPRGVLLRADEVIQ
jgi:putative ABC transport system substrate-binding protein